MEKEIYYNTDKGKLPEKAGRKASGLFSKENGGWVTEVFECRPFFKKRSGFFV